MGWMDKFPMEGCKVAGGLFQAELLYPSPEKGTLTGLLGRFAENHVNLGLMTGRQTGERLELSLLVSPGDAERARVLLQSDPDPAREGRFRPSIDVLTVFPHKGELRAVGLGLIALARKGVPLHGFCSSLSSLTFVIDSDDTEKALTALGACFDLPQDIRTARGG